jgi:tRNA pseudouridine55 synthase
MNGRKSYRFRIRWGVARTTDDREGEVVAECASRPSPAAIEEVLPRFTGAILQSPPPYSAIRINGRRAYKLARAAAPACGASAVQIAALRLIAILIADLRCVQAGAGNHIRAGP